MFYFMTNFYNFFMTNFLHIGTLIAKGGILIAKDGILIAKGGTLIEKPYNSQMYDKN